MDVGPAGSPEPSVVTTMPETTWIQPVSDTAVVSHDADPAEAAEALRPAFAALQHLPPRHRAALILCESLR